MLRVVQGTFYFFANTVVVCAGAGLNTMKRTMSCSLRMSKRWFFANTVVVCAGAGLNKMFDFSISAKWKSTRNPDFSGIRPFRVNSSGQLLKGSRACPEELACETAWSQRNPGCRQVDILLKLKNPAFIQPCSGQNIPQTPRRRARTPCARKYTRRLIQVNPTYQVWLFPDFC